MEMLILLVVLGLVLGAAMVPALIAYLIVKSHVDRLRRRIEELEFKISRLKEIRPTVTGPPVTAKPSHESFTPDTIKAEPLPSPAKAETAPGFKMTESVPEPVEKKPDTPSVPSPPAADRPVDIPSTPAAEPRPPSPPPPPVKPPSTPSRSFEELLATRWTTWLGALALLLAGVFLVKISIDRGLIGPKVRVTLAYLGGIALMGAGEFLRMRTFFAAQGAAAGGVAILFAATMASCNLYHFIPVTVAMGMILIITTVAILFALRTGMVVAVIGLLGGFSLPIFLQTEQPRVWALLAYLLIIHVATSFVARHRAWLPVYWLSTLGMVIWGFIYTGVYAGDHPYTVGVLVLAALLSLFTLSRQQRDASVNQLFSGILFSLFFLVMILSCRPQQLPGWGMLAVLSLAVIFLSGRTPFHGVAFMGLTLTIVREIVLIQAAPPHPHAAAILCFVGLIWTVGPWIRHWRSDHPFPNLTVASLAALGTMALLYNFSLDNPLPLPIGAVSLLWAVLLVVGALPLLNRPSLEDQSRRLAVLLGGATILVSAAVPMELEKSWITVLWAVEVPVLILLYRKLGVRFLKILAQVLSLLVGIRLLLNPAIFYYPTGSTPVFNWILYAYGIPLAAFFLSGKILKRMEEAVEASWFYWGARIMALVLVTLEIRHYFHGSLRGDMDNLWEYAVYVHAWFLLSYLFKFINVKFYSPQDHLAAGLSGTGAALLHALFCVLALNPLIYSVVLGETPILNGMIFIYGLPILWCLVSARHVHLTDPEFSRFYRIYAYVLAAFWLTLEVRHLFHSSNMHAGGVSDMEQYTYSAAWILLAVATLAGGILRKSKPLRYASLVVMMLSVAKVFILDITALSLEHRALSFLGLGVSLIAISILYQKFVFRDDRTGD